MSTIYLSVEQFPTWILSTHAQRRRVFQWAAVSTAMWGRIEAVKKATDLKAVDRGRFRAGYTVKIGSPVSNTLARLYNPVPYAKYVEGGMPKGIVPSPDDKIVGAIRKWVERKIVPDLANGKDLGKDDIFAIARGVQQKLHDKGYKGRPILTSYNMRRQLAARTRANILSGFKRDVGTLGGGMNVNHI